MCSPYPEPSSLYRQREEELGWLQGTRSPDAKDLKQPSGCRHTKGLRESSLCQGRPRQDSRGSPSPGGFHCSGEEDGPWPRGKGDDNFLFGGEKRAP